MRLAYKLLALLVAIMCVTYTQAQVVPDFTPNTFSACPPATIIFTNTSTGSAKSFSWTFGNGNSSNFIDASTIYDRPGIFNVTLTAVDGAGVSTSVSKQITIYKLPKVNFNVSAQRICERENVQFTDASTAGSGPLKTWLWDFGDGYTSPQKSAIHQYTNSSFYTIKLFVTDTFGCSWDTVKTNYIEIKEKPQVNFSFPDNRACKAPITINVTNYTPSANTSFKWIFGDGQMSTTYSPSHTYTSAGKYDVKLVAKHTSGCSDSLTQSNKVEIAPLVVDFTFPDTICEGSIFELEEYIVPRLTSSTVYQWTFDNKTSATGEKVTKKLPAGKQNIKLEVTNGQCSGTKTKEVNINNLPKNTIQNPSAICGEQPLVISTFDSTGIDSFFWRIDNSQNRFDVRSLNVFNKEGEHYISLYQMNDAGCEVTYVDTIYQSFGRFSPSADTGACVPFNYKPYLIAKGIWAVDSIFWDFTEFGLSKYQGFSPPTLRIVDTGYYGLPIKIKDKSGCTFNIVNTIGGGNKPVAAYALEQDTICVGESLHLTNTSKAPNKPNAFRWKIANQSAVTKSFDAQMKEFPGDLDVLHIVSHYGCSDSVLDKNVINLKGPYGSFSLQEDSCITSQKKVLGILKEVDSFSYSINDVFLSSDTTFTYTFSNLDNLKLWTYNRTSGCKDSLIQMIKVKDSAKLSWFVDAGVCAPAPVLVERFKENIDSIKWYLNGINTQHQLPSVYTLKSQGGAVRVKLVGYANGGCSIELDTVINVIGARLDSKVGQSFGCFPKVLTLIDSFWNDANNIRRWVIDGDTIPSNSVVTKYTISGLKDPSSKVIKVNILADLDSCESTQQFNLAHNGVTFTSSYTDSIINCNVSQFTFKMDVSSDQLRKVTGYQFRYKGSTNYSSSPVFKQQMLLNNKADTVFLTVLNTTGCNTTQFLIVNKPKPAIYANFSSSNPIAPCAPLQVNFKDESSSLFGKIVAHEWRIDNKFFSSAPNPTRIFTEPSNYKVALKITDERGCIDSVVLDSVVRIKGAIVELAFGQNTLCSNDTFWGFVTKGNAVKFEWDMGDGSVLLGDRISYRYDNAGSYKIKVLVSDSSNCKYPIENSDPILVYKSPVARFVGESRCVNDILTLYDSTSASQKITQRTWDIDGNKITALNKVKYTTGSTDVRAKLTVVDSAGCKDSIEETIKLYKIEADFSIDQAYYCIGDNIKTTDLSNSDTSMLSYSYSVSGNVIGSSKNTTFKIVDEGSFDLKLKVINKAGCKDSITKEAIIKVVGPQNKSNATLRYLSVGENNEVFFNLVKDTTGLFEKYELYNAASTKIWESSNATNTSGTLIGLNPQKSSVCLKLVGTNRCEAPDISVLEEHCTINTFGQSAPMSRIVRWNAYAGWKKIDGYDIYREGDAGYELIAKVPADSLSYTDTEHLNCDAAQHYKVAAYGLDVSYSDTCHIKPVWNYTTKPVKLSNVTVNTGNQIELSIEPSSGALIPISGLEILRTGEVTDVISSPNVLAYLDNSVNTQQRSYSYKVRQVDECGGISAPSNTVNSIYLKVENDLSLYPLLTWTQERIWDTKFEQYQVFKKDNEVSVLIATVSGKLDTTYLDKTGDIECASEACYQVVALSQDGLSSYSNSNCTGSSSALFAPNAMSPNGDGLNDVYRIRGLYISQFHFEVYTRWGEKIFETDECMQPWDGTYLGKRVPSGCYFYVVNAIGADRVRHYSNGTLTVLE